MADYLIPVGIDPNGVSSGFNEIREQINQTQRAAQEASSALQAGLNRGVQAAANLTTAVRNTNNQMHTTTSGARSLENAIHQVVNETQRVGNTEPVNRFRAAWDRANTFFRSGRTTIREFFGGVREGVNQAISDLRRYEAEAQRASRQPPPRNARGQFAGGSGGRGGGGNGGGSEGGEGAGLGDTVASIGDLVTGGLITGGIVGLITGLGALGKKAIETRAEFQKFEEVLTISLGERSQAQAAMKQIAEFATVTPFGVKELTEDYVKLVGAGLIPTKKELTQIGDLASSKGKSFDQLTEAIIDAQTGEFERLKEFQIQASSAGDKVSLSFGGVTKTVKKSADEIRNAIIAFGALPQIAGSSAAIASTLEGQISNLGDSVDQLFNTLGEGIQNVVAETAGGASVVISALNEGLKDGTIAGFFQPITDGFKDLASGFKSGYDAVINFAKTSGVFDQYTHAIDSLVEIIGGLIGGLGDVIKYVVELYTEGGTFKTIIDNTLLLPLRLVWAMTINLIEGIRAIPYAFEALKAGVSTAIDNVRFNFKALIDDLEIIRLKVKQAFTFDDDKAAGLKTQIEALEKDKQSYISKVKNVADAAQEAFLKAEAEAEARRKARKAGKPADETEDVAITGRGLKAPPKAASDAEIKKALDLQKKKNDQLLKLAQELRDAELSLMKDGYDKQRLVIEDSYKTRIENVTKEKALTTKAGEEQKKIVTLLEKAKNADLEKLRLDHIKKEAELQAEVQKIELEGQKDGADKEKKKIDIEFDARAVAIKENFKDEAALRDAALSALETARTSAKKGVDLNFNLDGIQAQEDAAIEGLQIIQKYGKLSVNQERAIQLEILKIKIKAAEDTVAALLDGGKDEADAQVISARNVLKALNAEFKDTSTKTKKYDIFDLFGLDITEEEKNQLTGAFQSLMGSLNNIWESSINAQIDIKQKQIDQLDEQVDKLQENVDKQKELADQGLANDLSVAQTALDTKKAQRDKEQADLEALQKKQNKMQQAQIAANGIAQVSNLVLSATQIFAAHSGIPFVGVALAVAAVAAMYATFAGMKAKAAELNKTTTYRTGGEIKSGRDHAQGGEKYYNATGDVKELEVGEFIMNRNSTNKYRDLIEALNNDDTPNIIKYGGDWLRDELQGTGVHLADDVTESGIKQAKTVQQLEITRKNSPALSGAWNDERLDKMEKHLDFLATHTRNKPETTETPTHIITKTPNRITKLRKT